jgi:D-alanine-D-alanine ligase
VKPHVLVTFDAEFARRTQLHNAKHPVKRGDDFFALVGDAGPVGEALAANGFKVSRLGVGRDVAKTLPKALRGVSLVFNLCDTIDGESRLAPVLPALLEAHEVPFVGADQFGLAISKRKHDVKALLDREVLPSPRYQVISSREQLDDFELTLEAPVILKLTAEHSSIGLASTSVCFDVNEVKACARGLLKKYAQPVLLEEYVHGREFYVSFFGRPLKPLPMMEHSFEALPEGFLPIRTFDMKWFNDPGRGGEKPRKDPRWAQPVPHRSPSSPWRGSIDDIPEICRRALEVSGGRDWGRVDLRLDRGGVPMIIDVTPNTYLGPSAPCVRAAEADGMTYAKLVTRIAKEALK